MTSSSSSTSKTTSVPPQIAQQLAASPEHAPTFAMSLFTLQERVLHHEGLCRHGASWPIDQPFLPLRGRHNDGDHKGEETRLHSTLFATIDEALRIVNDEPSTTGATKRQALALQ